MIKTTLHTTPLMKSLFMDIYLKFGYGALVCILLSVLTGCSSQKSIREIDEDVLLTLGDSTLRKQDVVMLIPGGLAPEDSAEMFQNIVESWVEEQLISSLATENIVDMERIDRLTKQYRSRLIADSYRRQLRENGHFNVPEDSVRKYYNANRENLLLERPIVKGIMIKIPSDARKLNEVRSWLFSGRNEDIDKLEKYGINETLQYSFFENRWVDWQNIAEQIPYRFQDGDIFLQNSKNFETTYNGITYLLHISDYRLEGKEMPEDYAKIAIAERLETESLAAYETKLLSSLVRQAVKEGKLKGISYDPVNHRMINQ